jgi:hypothetical protein
VTNNASYLRKRLMRVAAVAIACAAMAAGLGPPASGTSADEAALKTPWGDPDLQGIWTDETDTPLQRPAEYANQEFFTPEQRVELNNERARMIALDHHAQRGTEADVSGAYNSVFLSIKPVGLRTSLIVDPPNGRIPPLTPEAQKIAAAERVYRLAMLQSTDTCKNHEQACAGGKYDSKPSPLREQLPPRYITGRFNRHDGPEDVSLAERCLTGGLPEFGTAFGGSFRRIVQAPGGITMFYDVGQGQGWQRNIVMNGGPHLPPNIRQWFGDSRGHWEGNTLVIDVTNFGPKTDFQGSRENLHLVERWTRTGPRSLSYQVTIEDPTVWTHTWTVEQEFTKQNDQENRIYTEPRCVEGNLGLPGILHGWRVEEALFATGKGPDPATHDGEKSGFLLDEDPLR